ncbi:PP2C family protein-serine/threonine phosphatase [Bacteroidota bacterium]
MAKENPIKRIFDLYTSDLSFDEIQKLIKRESTEVYEFFAADLPKTDSSQNKFTRALIFARNLFNAFLLKLKPARRIFYLAAILFFLVGYFQEINSYLIVGFLILNLLIAFELADKLTTKDELDLARKIQSDLIPKNPPENKHYEIAAYYESAKEVGGDYFDIIENQGEIKKTYIVIGDISGKGMGAALYMTRVQAIIQLLIANLNSVKDVVINLKKYFSKNLRKEYFLTLVMASIDGRGGLRLCNAGHSPVLHYKYSEDNFDELNPKGLGIGLNDKGTFEKVLEESKVLPKKNDLLIFYTDGLTETMNNKKSQFGINTLKRIVRRYVDNSTDSIKNEILKEVAIFRGDAAKSDDLTLIILKKK